MSKIEDFGFLRVIQGPDQGKRFPIQDQVVFGRASECDACLTDQSISRQHFRIRIMRGEVEIEDLDSSNGTKLNGRHVTIAALNPGDKVEFGDTVLVYEAKGLRKRVRLGPVLAALLILVVSVVILLIHGAQQAKRRETIAGQRKFAEEMERQKNYEEAVIAYKTLSEIDHGSDYREKISYLSRREGLEKILVRVALAAKSQDFEQASRLLDSLQANWPEEPELKKLVSQMQQDRALFVLMPQVRLLVDNNRFDPALELLDSLYRITLDPSLQSKKITVMLKKGYYLQRKGTFAKAREAFDAVLKLEPDNEEAIQALANLKTIRRSDLEHIVRKKTGPPPKETLRVKPPEPEPEIPQVTKAQKARAKDIYNQGLRALKDHDDTATAVDKFREVLQLAPDPGFKYYKKATERLRELGKL